MTNQNCGVWYFLAKAFKEWEFKADGEMIHYPSKRGRHGKGKN